MPSFENPIIPGFHPDPSICRVGRDFYLVTSSFEYFPGIPIFHSRDLVSWTQLGHVLTRPSQLDLEGVRSSGGIYAPTIRHARGRFTVVTTHVDRGGNFLVTAERPEGPWSDPIWIDRDGIDPSLCFTGGRVFYTRNGPGPDRDHPLIYQAEVEVRTGKLRGDPKPIWSGLGGIWPEAPHLYRIGRWYYLLTAEGGTGYDHSIVVARSRSPNGPFESCPDNPVLTHRDHPRHPIQATGHADLVELADGTWWMVLLGVRPFFARDRTTAAPRRHHHLGRETFLAPVTWTKQGWPRIGNGVGKPGRVELSMRAPSLVARAARPAAPARDDFDADALAPEWNFLRNPRARDWSLTDRAGHLRLMGSAVSLDEVDSPALLLRRQQHARVRCRTRLDFTPRAANEEAGLCVRATESFHYRLAVVRSSSRAGAGRHVILKARVRGRTRVLGRLALSGAGAVWLQIDATERWYVFRVGLDPARLGRQPRMRRLGKLPSRDLSSENIWSSGMNYFTGVFFGLYATGNGRASTAAADFDWLDYQGISSNKSHVITLTKYDNHMR